MAFAGFALLLGFSVGAVVFNMPALVVAGLLILFIFGGVSTMFRGGSLSTIKQEMHADYIKQALHAYDNGNQEEAAALFARAERHGALSEHHSNIYSECRK